MKHGTIHVIGVDLQHAFSVPGTVLEKCSAIVGSNRFLKVLPEIIPDHEKYATIPITPLTGAARKIQDHLCRGDVAVLASGDPLFFGIGRRLIDMFGRRNIKIYPALSSIQHAFARFGIPWDDATFVSLHGRNPENHVGTLLASAKTAVLTDGQHRPETIARDLLAFLADKEGCCTLFVAEDLGMESERLTTGTIREISKMTFGSLCCMLIVRNAVPSENAARFGLTENDIIHSRGLITKSEVRAAVLHALAIPPNSILWDIGAGSGSVGLEAARLYPDMLVYSIEKHPEQQENILANTRKHDVINLKLIKGEAPGGLAGLPRPHRIFIGGSGGNLADIIEACVRQLRPDGKIVVTGVLEKTCREAPELLHRSGLQVEIHRVEVQRMVYPTTEEKNVFNPINIIIGQKTTQ